MKPFVRLAPVRRRAAQLLLVIALAGALVYQSSRLEAQTGQPPPTAPPVVRLALHGSTPAMAWSPDSKRVVVNSAYSYYGYDGEIAANAAGLGVYVVDVATKATTHVFVGQAYHPFWLDAGTLGWGHSEYEDGEPGIYLSPVTPSSQPRKIGPYRGVHRTLLARGRQKILAYIGFPEYHRWVYVDPRSGQHSTIPSLSSTSSWDTPESLREDQCLTRAGQVQLLPGPASQPGPGQIVTRGGGSVPGFIVQRGNQRALLGGPLYLYSGDRSGVVQPCLSPDGRHVAYLAATQGIGDYALTIARVP